MNALEKAQLAIFKAEALALMTWGEQGEAFRCLHDDTQDRFMWALSDLLGDVKEAIEVALDERFAAKKGGAA